ncbi:hypothetical protein B0H13DRAFT_2037139 [Mycena leptocephala]|nr:hypothetical protein B0H13DRAFT_2037139 [Mycena leptocephala]
MTLAGYIGCFSIVQDHRSISIDIYQWLGLEFILAFLRVIVWAWNPAFDDPAGILFHLKPTTNVPLSPVSGANSSTDTATVTTRNFSGGNTPAGDASGDKTQLSPNSLGWIKIMGEVEFWETFTASFGPVNIGEIQRIDGFEHWYAWVQLPRRQGHAEQPRPDDPGAEKKLYIILKGKHRILCTLSDPDTIAPLQEEARELTFHPAASPSDNTLVDAVYLPVPVKKIGHRT